MSRAIPTPAGASERPKGTEQRLSIRLQLLASGSCAYAILASLSQLTGPHDTAIAEIWLPAGLSYALALRVGAWAIPIPLLGVLLSHLSAGDALTLGVITIGLAHSCGTALMVVVARQWMNGLDLLASLRNLLVFLGSAALAAALTTVIAALALPNLRTWSLQGDALGWSGSVVAGVIVVSPVLLCWMGRSCAPRLRELRRPEFLLLLMCSLMAVVIVDQGVIPVLSLRPQTLLVPLTLWSGLRFSPASATLANLVLAVGLSVLPDQDTSLLDLTGGLESQELLEVGVITSLLAGLVVLVISNNRARACRQLAQLAGSLERSVAERTEELASANAQLRQLSQTDSLTGLANRRQFDAVLRERWRQASAAGRSLAVALIDVDHFKLYNDRHGHQQGDLCLQRVASVLGAQIRNGYDCAARYGGEEFAILWSDLNSAQAGERARQLCRAISALKLPHGASPVGPWVSVSIGVVSQSLERTAAAAPADELQHRIEALLQQADERLYAAKAQGRNRVAG